MVTDYLVLHYSKKENKPIYSHAILFHILLYFLSPRQPVFGGWGFNLPRGEQILKKWNKIPNNTDILITHGPLLGK